MKGYEPRTPEQIKEIALQLYRGEIFTSNHSAVQSSEALAGVFMILQMGAFKDWTQQEVDEIGMLYEHMDKAMPRSMNGLPMFMSVRFLDKKDAEAVLEIYKKIKEGVDKIT